MSDTVAIAIVGSITTIASAILNVISAKMNNVKADVRAVKGMVHELTASTTSYIPPAVPLAREPTRNAD
jgi:hypothetical protein